MKSARARWYGTATKPGCTTRQSQGGFRWCGRNRSRRMVASSSGRPRGSHRAWFEPRGADDPNLVDRPCVLVQRTTAKEQHRRLIAAEMPPSVFGRPKLVAVENHLNMVRPIGRRPKVPLHVVAAFLATEAADRVLRCINASVAVSASELGAMPLPLPEAVTAAMEQRKRGSDALV